MPGVDNILLNYQFDLGAGRTASFRPSNVGFGISYALSVIVSLLASEKDNIIIIENPEAHIHPKGQVELGKLMALSAASGAQLFIETHSDHIINGIRVAVKEGLIDKKDVSFSYFTKVTTKEEQYTEITEIKVDKRGDRRIVKRINALIKDINSRYLQLQRRIINESTITETGLFFTYWDNKIYYSIYS